MEGLTFASPLSSPQWETVPTEVVMLVIDGGALEETIRRIEAAIERVGHALIVVALSDAVARLSACAPKEPRRLPSFMIEVPTAMPAGNLDERHCSNPAAPIPERIRRQQSRAAYNQANPYQRRSRR